MLQIDSIPDYRTLCILISVNGLSVDLLVRYFNLIKFNYSKRHTKSVILFSQHVLRVRNFSFFFSGLVLIH